LLSINAALQHMPIPNAIAIFFVEPLILTLMSAAILGEKLGWRRLSAVAAGLIGAMIVIRPNWEAFGPAAVYPLITAVCFASYLLITRVMTQKGGRVALQFWIGFFAMLALALATAIGDPLGVPVLNAFARAEAGVLAPLQYLEIISAVLIGWFVFADFPDRLTWIGTAIIIGAGIYVFYRERQLARPLA
jgi:drug/metabolite transporter (DMT)-like permease